MKKQGWTITIVNDEGNIVRGPYHSYDYDQLGRYASDKMRNLPEGYELTVKSGIDVPAFAKDFRGTFETLRTP